MSFELQVYGAAERALSRIDRLKTLLLHASTSPAAAVSTTNYSQEIRAACIIFSMAELESLVKSVLHASNEKINSRAHTTSSVKPCLRSLAGHNIFDSLQMTKDPQRMWENRGRVTSFESSTEILNLPIVHNYAQPPLDGQTLSPRHFIRIWNIYGLSGNWFPSVSCAMTLTKLNGTRNDLAHGNIPFSDVFSQAGLSVNDIETYMDEMCWLYIHFADTFFNHIDKKGYL